MRVRALPILLTGLVMACGEDIDEYPITGGDTQTPVTTREFANVAYANTSAAQRLDLYLPPTGNGPFPVVVWVHGGGWQSGSRTIAANGFQRDLLAAGIALATADYRLSDEAIWPAQIHDVKAAVRHLRANATTYHLDTARVGAWGSSAGGHLVSMLGTTGGVAALEGTLGNPTMSSRVRAVADWYGPADLLRMDEHALAIGCRGTAHNSAQSAESALVGGPLQERATIAREASPVSWVSSDDATFFMQHGNADCTVAYPQSDAFRDLLRAAIGTSRVSHELIVGAGHGGPEFTAHANVDKVVAFFTRELGAR